MTETFKQATRISGITAPITIVGEEDEQSFTGGTAVKVSSSVSVDGDNDDDNGDLIRNHRSDASSNSSSSSSSSSGVDSQLDSDDEESYNSESTRSCTFSIYCLMHEDGAFEDGSTGDDDCSSISTVSNFVREKEDEEAYYNNLDDSFTYASCSDSDADDEDSENDCDVVEVLKSQTEKSKAAAKDGERAVFDDENVSKDNSDFTSDDDDNDDDDDDDDDDYYDESYDEDLDEDEDKEGDQELYDDEYGDEYGNDQEEVVEELLEESDRSQLSHSSSGPASDIVFEKNKRIFSNANSRQSHSNQMALFLKNIAETKAAVGIVDDEEPEIEVIEEEVVDEEEDETEVEYVDETEVDEDDEEDFVYEVLLSPKAKNKETRRNRLSFLSV
ncbi:unnamed protein product [Cylindrotheca closterium]|uniref:Uncharacterized protein n=1 Tax=Cylindrotheca closterium TaxID=2856 RepID=A0AAD2PWY9_9STRA|nr:unnamed protein product [Cylindrotheca closterium]